MQHFSHGITRFHSQVLLSFDITFVAGRFLSDCMGWHDIIEIVCHVNVYMNRFFVT